MLRYAEACSREREGLSDLELAPSEYLRMTIANAFEA